jgi:hypothetical protein
MPHHWEVHCTRLEKFLAKPFGGVGKTPEDCSGGGSC